MRAREWGAFWLLGMIWGSSYLVAFLGESVSAQSAAGTLLAVAGIVVANRPARPRIVPAVAAGAAGDG